MNKMLEEGTISDVNIMYSFRTALMHQAEHGTVEDMTFLLAHDALPNLKGRGGNTALHYAVLSNDPAKVRLLLDRRAEKTIMNNRGETALDWARNYTVFRL